MAASDSPPVGLRHPTANPRSNTAASTTNQSSSCSCNDCDYTVEIGTDLPPKCPECGGALMRSEA